MMANPLNTSFTLRPSKHGKPGAELTLRKRDATVAPRVPLSRHRENAGSDNGSSSRSIRGSKLRPPFKRQRLFMDRAAMVPPTPAATLHRRHNFFSGRHHADFVDSPLHGPPPEFEPPRDEDYWKRRCFRMRDRCAESHVRVREMEEDQRQLRRRILMLEEQLLIQSSSCLYHQSTHPCAGASPVRAPEFNGVDTMGGETCRSESDGGAEPGTPPRLGPDQTTGSGDGHDRGRAAAGARPSKGCISSPPTRVVAVPRDSSKSHIASCFYLTDGEGLSDSDHDDFEDDCMVDDDDDDDDDDRNDSGNHDRG